MIISHNFLLLKYFELVVIWNKHIHIVVMAISPYYLLHFYLIYAVQIYDHYKSFSLSGALVLAYETAV